MRKGYSMIPDHRGSWAWLSIALLVLFGVVINASNRTVGTDVEVGENICFPVHWCLPGTTGESAIEVAPTADAPPPVERIDARAGTVSRKCSVVVGYHHGLFTLVITSDSPKVV